MRRSLLPVAAAVAALAAAVPITAGTAAASGGSTLFIRSAVEHPDGTATFPLHRGTSQGRTVYYLQLDSSDGDRAQAIGVNRSQKLANAAGTDAVQHVTIPSGVVNFPATVDFSPERVVQAPTGFPPTVAVPGAVGEAGYSPLIQRPDGTVDNAPQIARDQNGDGRIDLRTEAADKVVAIDTARLTVTYRETDGFQGGKAVRYVSTDATDPLAAALEDATLAPKLNAAPRAGDDSTASARAELVGFVNGQTGAANPQRQGLNSAVAGDGDPLNVLAWNPGQGRYSPLWDVHLAQWSAADVAARTNVRQTDTGTIDGLAQKGRITAPGGGTFGASGFIVDCPIVSFA
ncbi:MAG TPA: hypothetical protein VLM05_04065 [Mycobacteriales bacterium]|nr:hypothetical protein [Mycobacteriales bacterium]